MMAGVVLPAVPIPEGDAMVLGPWSCFSFSWWTGVLLAATPWWRLGWAAAGNTNFTGVWLHEAAAVHQARCLDGSPPRERE